MELFRINWNFIDAKTLGDRFTNAVSNESVIYDVVDAVSGTVNSLSGTWWFRNRAGDIVSRFKATSTACCFTD